MLRPAAAEYDRDPDLALLAHSSSSPRFRAPAVLAAPGIVPVPQTPYRSGLADLLASSSTASPISSP